MCSKLCHLMVIFVMLKWYKLLYYKEILSIYWMTLVCQVLEVLFDYFCTLNFKILDITPDDTRRKPSSKIFYCPFQGGAFLWIFLCFSFFSLLCLTARLFICALWSFSGKVLTSWFSCVVSKCGFVIFPLVSWVRCGT